MEKRYEKIDKIIEYGIYVYIFIMFLAKGEGIRNILIFGIFGLWLMTLKHRRNLYILKDKISMLCWLFLGTIIISVIFSIDPLYSIKEFKNEPLKFALLYPVIATTITNKNGLKNASLISFFALVLIVSFSYYSYFAFETPVLKPQTVLVNAHYNRFAGYINTLIPISFVLYFLLKSKMQKQLLIAALVFSIISLILSTSRGGYVSFLGIAFVWSLYLSRLKGYNFKKIIASIFAALTLLVVLSYAFNPDVKDRLSETSEQMHSLSNRIDLWGSALYAINKRPVIGWGYGSDIFLNSEPFDGNPYKKDPIKGPHNMFITVAFHQGIIGLLSFCLLIVMPIVTFWREAFKSSGVKSYMLIACVSIFIGNYVLHAQLESMFRLQYIAVVLGLGMAAKGINENSDN